MKYLAAFLALAAALALGALWLLQDRSAVTLPSGAAASAPVEKLGWRRPELVSPEEVRPPAAPAVIDDMPPAPQRHRRAFLRADCRRLSAFPRSSPLKPLRRHSAR